MASLSAVVSDGPTIGPDHDDLWFESLTRVGQGWRRAYASSPFHHGSTLIAATLNHAQLDGVLYAKAASAAALKALRDDVNEAFSQFSYTLAVTESGVTETWTCDPADVQWNEHDSGMANLFLARATITIPCYPVPS